MQQSNGEIIFWQHYVYVERRPEIIFFAFFFGQLQRTSRDNFHLLPISIVSLKQHHIYKLELLWRVLIEKIKFKILISDFCCKIFDGFLTVTEVKSKPVTF